MANGIDHVPVLLDEAISALAISASDHLIDGTYGRGGHARALLNSLGPDGKLLVVDQDPEAIAHANVHFGDDPRVTIKHANFSDLVFITREMGWFGRVDGILLDLGVSSPQLDQPARGFSFMSKGPLDMRMDTTTGISAGEWLNDVDQATLAAVIKDYGEERHAKRIAQAIVKARAEKPLEDTHQLASVIAGVVRGRPGHHPATRTFQAIRIFINRELDVLSAVLDQLTDILAPGGRMAVISFHSLEDRLVKQAWNRQAKPPAASRREPLPKPFKPKLKLIGKPVTADEQACRENPRARSARLRVAERLYGKAA